MPDERKVKGSVVSDMVRIIRALKDLPWDKYLLPEDFEIIDSMIIPTAWYPIEFYQRTGLAVYRLAAAGNDKLVKDFGEKAMIELFEGPYRPFLDHGDPVVAIRKFLDLRRPLFNFSRMEARSLGPNSLLVSITDFGEFEAGLEMFMTLTGAHLTKLAELNGAGQVKLDPSHSRQQEDISIEFRLTWE